MEKDEAFEDNNNQNNNGTGCLIAFIILIVIIVIVWNLIVGWWNSLGHDSNTSKTNTSNITNISRSSLDTSSINTNSLSADSISNAETPDEIELMTYAQTVLKDNLSNPKYSSYKGDYTFIGTGLRYKIEGKVNDEDFWMIIQFVDDSYEQYDLISLQVGDDMIYKK